MAKGRLGEKAGAVKGIKCKVKRQQVYHKLKKEGDKAQRLARKLRKKEAEELGEAAPVRVQRTLDNTREEDETMVRPDDEEVAGEDSFDEFSAHFSGAVPPRTMVTTSAGASEQLLSFLEEILLILPNSEYRKRGSVPIKKIVDACASRGFTNLLVFTEKARGPPPQCLPREPREPMLPAHLPSSLHTHAPLARAGEGCQVDVDDQTPARSDRPLQADLHRPPQAHRRPRPADRPPSGADPQPLLDAAGSPPRQDARDALSSRSAVQGKAGAQIRPANSRRAAGIRSCGESRGHARRQR